ncbi:MAG: cation transporter [Lachnospiraceae bacterium]|nr:cation transporter [Lachnospiraceae bacterium]
MSNERDNAIVKTSIIAILSNVLLVAFKMTIGFLSNSIAIILDAINNLSDAMSSIITIIGTKLANRKPDKKHPLGHGRIEYLTAVIISGIVLYAGITSLIESIKSIIEKTTPHYTNIMLVIIAVAVLVKIFLGRFVKKQGEKYNSDALVASGSDAMFDAVLSFSVLASAIIFKLTNISLESYVAVIISIFIIRAGIEMLKDTLDEILGRRADKELTLKIKKIVSSFEQVRGAYDLFIYNYGPNKDYASIHIEVPDTMTIAEYDVLVRQIEQEVYHKTGVILTGISAYSYNTKDDEVSQIRNKIHNIIFNHDFVIQMHGFYINKETKEMRFDAVMSFDIAADEGVNILMTDLKEAFPEYQFVITPDIDISE